MKKALILFVIVATVICFAFTRNIFEIVIEYHLKIFGNRATSMLY